VDKDGNIKTKDRLFKFEKENLKVTVRIDQPNTAPVGVKLSYDADGFGILVSPNSFLYPDTNYVVTFTANVQECTLPIVQTQRSDQPDGYSNLKTATCNGGGWTPAKLANGTLFQETRRIKFRTNGGPMRLDPKMVVYSLPHHGQRFYCYQDFTQQATLAMSGDRERVMTADRFYRPDRSQACRLKMRLIPSGADADALDAFEVEVKAGGIFDPALEQGAFGASRYVATKADNYWISPLMRTLQAGTTYGAQFFLEWDAPPPPQNSGMASFATSIKRTSLANGMASLTERELNIKKYRLGGNQREVYRYYFKASQYSSIEQKINDLKRNQLVFKWLRPGENLATSSEIIAPTSLDWNLVAQQLKQIYPPEALNPVQDRHIGAQGIFLSKAGYDGPEKFDVFDVNGFEKTIGNKSYKVQPLISLDGDELLNWWRAQFDQSIEILLQNGVREAALPPPGIRTAGWIFTEPKLKINGVMDSITTDGALGNGNPSMITSLYPSAQQAFYTPMSRHSNMAVNIMAPSSTHLLEVRRDVERMMGTVPGALPPGMNWVNNVLNGGWVGASDGPMEDQIMTNIGAAYDFVSNLQQPVFNPQIGGANVGGGIHINAMQAAGAPAINVIQIGH
jgi:hypothetical protein